MSLIERFMKRVFGPSSGDEQRVLDTIPGVTDVPTAQWRSVGTGVYVTPATALNIAAVYACVRVLAESVASLPLKVYRRTPTGKVVADDHMLYTRLHDMANPEMSAFEFRETMMAHLLLWGNCYAEIEMNRRADVLALWPLLPARMQRVSRGADGRLQYTYDDPQRGPLVLDEFRVFHVRGLSSNGLMGLSPITLARNALSLAANIEQFGTSFFDNNASPGGILEHPGKLTDEAHRRLKTSWEDRHRGAANANKVAILEEGMKWASVGMPMTDAQFLESRKFQVSEIARMFRVPPHMIQDLERATFSNIEHQSLDFVVHSLRPWLVRWEQAITRSLIGEVERRTLFAEFLVDGLLRGDIQSRYQAYSIGRQWGWLSRNDVRSMENMNAIEGGDDYLSPLNMSVVGAAANQPSPQPPPEPPPGGGQPSPTGRGSSDAPTPNHPQGVASSSQREGSNAEAAQVLDAWIADAVQRIEARCGHDRDARHAVWVADVLRPICRVTEREDKIADEMARYYLDGSLMSGEMLMQTLRG